MTEIEDDEIRTRYNRPRNSNRIYVGDRLLRPALVAVAKKNSKK